MTLINKTLLLFISVFAVTLEAGMVPLSQWQPYIEKQLKQDVLMDYPVVITSSIQVVIHNQKVFTSPPQTAAQFKFHFNPEIDVLGKSVLPVSFYDSQGQFLERSKLAIDVQANAAFFRADRLLKRGTIVVSQDVKQEVLSLYGQPKNYVKTLEAIVGKEVVSTLAKSTVISKWMLKTPALVKQGEVVDVIMEKRGLELTFRGKVLSDGAQGDIIRVQCLLGSQKVIEGEVLDEKAVRAVSRN